MSDGKEIKTDRKTGRQVDTWVVDLAGEGQHE
jgi:hypothetical protein